MNDLCITSSPASGYAIPRSRTGVRARVQSVDGARVTVNFEHAGKMLINALVITLEPIDDDHDLRPV